MLLATPENMEKCKDIPGVVALDRLTENACSATLGDYLPRKPHDSLELGVGTDKQRSLVLAVKVCKWVDPITGEDIIAQNPAEKK